MPVAGISAEAISARSNFYRAQIELMINKSSLGGLRFYYHEAQPQIMSNVYFSLSQAYKKIYLKDGSNTDAIKRAAITCAMFSVVNPIRLPPEVNDAGHEEYFYVNPMLAMRIACGIIGHPFEKRPFDDQRRQLRGISNLTFPCTDPIIAESYSNNGVITTEFDVTLSSDEEAKLNILINDFSLYSLLKIPDQSAR